MCRPVVCPMGDGGRVKGTTHSARAPRLSVPSSKSPQRPCARLDLTGRQTARSVTRRQERTRHREQAAREALDREVRALLGAAPKELQERAMNRRVLLSAVTSGLLAAPPAAEAPQKSVPRIGILVLNRVTGPTRTRRPRRQASDQDYPHCFRRGW